MLKILRFSMVLMLSFVIRNEAALAAPPLEPVEVSGSAGWIEPVPRADRLNMGDDKDKYISERTGRLTFMDSSGSAHYCTAELITGYKQGDGGMPPSQASLLVTAAHCVRPGFKEFSFLSDSGTPIPTSEFKCYLRHDRWIDNAQGIVKQFINARLDYAFIKISKASLPFFNVEWVTTWAADDPYNFKDNIEVVGYADAAGRGAVPLSKLNKGNVITRQDLHRKLNAVSTSDLGFTRGSSGGAWLDVKDADKTKMKLVSVTSSYLGTTSSSGVGKYISIYGPMLHEDAHQLARSVEGSPTSSAGGLLEQCAP